MILTKSSSDKINIDELILQKVDTGSLRELLLVVPTNRKVRYLKRDIISSAPHQSVSEINIETLATLSTKLFNEVRNFNAKILSDASSVVLINQSFNEVELAYFSDYKKEIPRGTLELVKNVISEYKRQDIGPEDIRREAKQLTGSERYKALDIANIYSSYLKKTSELTAYELGDIYKYLIELNSNELLAAFFSLYTEANTFIINGFDEFSTPEIELINRLSDLHGISMYVVFDYFNYNSQIFAHLEKCYNNLIEKGFREIEDSSVAGFDHFRKNIRENLFSYKRAHKPESAIDIIKIAASNPSKEIEIIAKEIKNLIVNEKVNPDEICVVFNLISEHSYLIRDIFKNYGIPFNLTDRFSLSNSAPVIALINFLEILENDFYYKNIFRALSGKWIDINGVDLSNLLAVASNLKLVSGYNNWIGSIENVIELMADDNSDDEANYLPEWQYEKAATDIKKIFALLAVFKKKQTIESFKKNLIELIYLLNLPQKLINDKPENVEKNVKALTVLLETISELFELLQDEYGRHKTFPLSFYLREIKTASLFTRYNVKERHDKGVLVTSVNEIRGLKFKYLFLGGMVDGEFPTRYQPAIFFSGEHRKKRDEYRHLLEERYRFYQALCVPEKRLYLTYPVKAVNKELTESSFIADLQKIFSLNEKLESDYGNLIYSKEELLKLSGNEDIEAALDYTDLIKLKESVKTDNLRKINPFEESVYTGFITGNISNEAEEKLLSFKDREYSASQLEEYAKCPFRYFVNRILSLETIDEPSEDIEAFEIGSLIHSILYRFYSELNKLEITLADCSDKDFKTAEKLLFNIAEDKVNKIKFASPSSFFEREKIFGIDGKKENSILYQFLLTERISSEGFIPEYFEYEFGSFADQTSNADFELDGIKVRGKVDRIDINFVEKTFKVIDYKLGGKKPSRDDLLSGISLQLPLYMYASKIFIEAELNRKYQPLAAEIYSLKLTSKDFGRKSISTETKRNMNDEERILMNENIINIAADSITKYVKQIADGDFRLSQLEDRDSKICNYCEFKSICRIRDAN